MNESAPPPPDTQPAREVDRLRRRLERERAARLDAERIAEKGLRALYEQRENLQLLESIAVAANATTTVIDLLQFAIGEICRSKAWILGHAYLRERDGASERLVSAQACHAPGAERVDDFRIASETATFALGVGLPGRIWETRRPQWIYDILAESNFPRLAAARAAGLRTAFGFPVLVGDEVTAVLEFFTDVPVDPDEELLRLVAQIGTQIARVVERKRAEDKLVHDASHDPLTGLPNRALLRDRLTRAIGRSKRNRVYHYAVLFVDLDRFKMVNDSLGHSAGDQLIIQVAARLLSALRVSDLVMHPSPRIAGDAVDTLARLGGDEFIVLLDDLEDPGDALTVVRRVQEALQRPFQIEGREVYTTASIGLTSSSTGYSAADDVLRDADIAMYRAKTLGRARCEIYDDAMHASALKRFSVESDLRVALQNGEFLLHYQPIVCLRSGSIVRFEALVRWQKPDGSLVPPGDFISIAEETGLIVPLGTWVLVEACRKMGEWRRLFPDTQGIAMAVNVSARQFAQPDFAAHVRQVVTDAGIPPDTLTIEITESVTMGDVTRTVCLLEQLKAVGVNLSIDDFGTGYSSLSYLHRFPLDVLKIDRSFVAQMDGGEGYPIVQTIMALGNTLGMDVVAEGTETMEQIARLQMLGCGFAQGYFFSRPVDHLAAAALLAAPAFALPGAIAGAPTVEVHRGT